MKTLIIYKSRTGFTKQYAEWISEELSCEMKDYKDISKISFDEIEVLIYGGRVHAGMIDGINKIKELAKEKKCKLIVFATGATPMEAASEIEKMWTNNGIDDTIPHFYLQSGLCYEKMSLADKLMMKMFTKMMSSKKDKNEMEIEMTKAISKSYNASSKDFIAPLVEYVKNLKK